MTARKRQLPKGVQFRAQTATGICLEIHDGVISCRNESLDPVMLTWALGKVEVLGHTHFQGTPVIQSHAMLDPISREALNEALASEFA